MGDFEMNMVKNSKREKYRRHKLTIAYDGTRYAGWQVQPRHTTVQGELERVLKELTGHPVRVESSGRTDRGVHARAQVAHADLKTRTPVGKLQVGMNALLGPDIRILRVQHVPDSFHARYSAKGKEYRYFIWNHPVMDPFLRHTRTHIRDVLDVDGMTQAAAKLTGRHDFAAFSANPNREIDGTVRHLYALDVRKRGYEIVIRAHGDGFLYKMVRSLAGYLIRVGRGELTPDSAAMILDSKIRTARVPTARPEGLFLWRVQY